MREDSIDRSRETQAVSPSPVGGSFNDSSCPPVRPQRLRIEPAGFAPSSLRDGNDVEGPLASQRAASEQPACLQRVQPLGSSYSALLALKGGPQTRHLPPPSRQMQVITQQLNPYVPSLVSARCRRHLFCLLYLCETLEGASQPVN